MNNFIDLLTKEEKAILCEIITGREFKGLFISNEREFSKIQPGFRAKTLEEQRALSIAKAHVSNPFIAMFINLRVDNWLKGMQENIDKLEKEGKTRELALTMTLLDSVFENSLPLYFKLAGKTLDVDLLSEIYKCMMSLKCERIRSDEEEKRKKLLDEKQKVLNQFDAEQQQYEQNKKTELAECIKNLEADKQQEIKQLEDNHKQIIGEVNLKYQQIIKSFEEEKAKLESSLAKAQKQIAEYQSINTIDDYSDLSQYDDTDEELLPVIGSENFTSLCVVKTNFEGQKILIRCADLNYDGQYSIFYQNKNLEPFFANRTKIFGKNIYFDDGAYGIWDWSAKRSEVYPSKDYVRSEFNKYLIPIEVIKIYEASRLDELIDILKRGIECKPHSSKVMFAARMSNRQYVGILCNTKDGIAVLPEDCLEVPVYEFSSDDIIRLENGVCFYKKAFVGIPSKLYRLKSRLDIAKSIVLDSISWNTYRSKGLIVNDYEVFKDFIAEIPVADITCKIETACRCSKPEAKELLNTLLKVIWQYVDSECLEDKILLSAIYANTELQEKTKELLRTDWETENKQLLAEGQKKLVLLQEKLESTANDLSEAEDAYLRTKLEEEQRDSIISEKKKLADDVEAAVAERIEKARQNAADFIANMAFVSGPAINVAASETVTADATLASQSISTYQFSSLLENLVSPEVHHSWSDVINTAIFELGEAGVAEKHRSGLAAFLCAAYIEKQPIMLVGPNAIDIAKVFGAVVAGNKYGTLCCAGSYSGNIIKEIGTDGENIVIINNLFTSEWMNRIPEIFSQKDIFYIATHPYPEDIQVEPKSLYGFMLPLFTEFFVDEKATGEYDGGYFAEDFEAYTPSKVARKELKALSNLKLSNLIKNRINCIIATMHDIYPELTEDEEFLFGVLPIAYASLAINELKEVLADSHKGITISSSLKRDLQYVLGEF